MTAVGASGPTMLTNIGELASAGHPRGRVLGLRVV
jgi:hypothetical protein